MRWILPVLAASCGGVSSSPANDGAPPDDVATSDAIGTNAPDSPRCFATSLTNLVGVHIDIDASRCVFTLAEAAAGIGIGYDVVVDVAVPGVVARAQDAGNCGASDGSGLIAFETLEDAGQRYCLCDTGLCPPPSGIPITLVAGRYHHVFTWDGSNWSGPSDTGNPHGPPFPAGTYTLRVSAVGTQASDGSMIPFTTLGSLSITLVP